MFETKSEASYRESFPNSQNKLTFFPHFLMITAWYEGFFVCFALFFLKACHSLNYTTYYIVIVLRPSCN